MTTHHFRQHPIILVTGQLKHLLREPHGPADTFLTGTPGTGKTLHSHLLEVETASSSSPLKHLNIGEIVKQHGFHERWDEEWQSFTLDEDRLLDYLEEVVNPEDRPADTGELDLGTRHAL